MKPKELHPFLGGPCQVRVRCRACGGQHLMAGELEAGPNQGEVFLDGYCYSIEDIDDVRASAPEYSVRGAGGDDLRRWSLLLLGCAAALSAWARLLTPR